MTPNAPGGPPCVEPLEPAAPAPIPASRNALLLKTARRIVIFVIGISVMLLGIVGFLLPMVPGVVIVPLGLAILATEFAWARHFLRRVKNRVRQAKGQPAEPDA